MNDLTLLQTAIAELKPEVAIYGQLDSAFTELAETAQVGNAQTMWDNFCQYRDICKATGQTMYPGTAFFVMGLDIEDAKAILSGKMYKDTDVQAIVKKAKMQAMSSLEQASARGLIQPSVLIWYQKNFAGMTDFPEPVKLEVSDLNTMTPQEIAEKYKDIIE